MVITRTPLRISFVGGGSDRPSFSREEPGACVAAAIDKYVYVTVSEKFDGSIRAAYSTTENVSSVDDVQHELIREALKLTGVRGVEIHSIADIPGGTGLGSSSSFTVGVIKALENSQGRDRIWHKLADLACEVELGRCHKPIGKQDQYAAAFGGLRLYSFHGDNVSVTPLACDLAALSRHALLLYTGRARQGDAGAELAAQRQDRDGVRALARMAPLFADALVANDWLACGVLLDRAWEVKRRFVGGACDAWYAAARDAGAWGGKLCGAGGGGFLLFLAHPEAHAAIVQATGLRRVPVRFGAQGSEVLYAG